MDSTIMRQIIQEVVIGHQITSAVEAAIKSVDLRTTDGQDAAVVIASTTARNIHRSMGREPSEPRLRFVAFFHIYVRLQYLGQDVVDVDSLTDFVNRHRQDIGCKHPEVLSCSECPGHDA